MHQAVAEEVVEEAAKVELAGAREEEVKEEQEDREGEARGNEEKKIQASYVSAF